MSGKGDHVLICNDSKSYLMVCLNCGRSLPVAAPMPMVEFLERCSAFNSEHSGCLPGDESLTINEARTKFHLHGELVTRI